MDIINLRSVVAEDFSNYKSPAMFLITGYCDFKCCHEGGFPESICQNEPLIKGTSIKDFRMETLLRAYTQNPITKAVVFGGMEPMLQFDEVSEFINKLRNEYKCSDPVIIYTGYYPEELEEELPILEKYENIIVKFGRYIPGHKPHYDDILGIELASDNQYAKKIG